jgi:hypothetical protein
MAMTDLGKLLLVVGGVIFLIGAVLLLAGKSSIFYFPIVTCILISVVLSLILWLFGRGHR